MAGINQIKISELPTKETPSTNDYLVVDDGTTTYKAKLSTVIDTVISVAINAEY